MKRNTEKLLRDWRSFVSRYRQEFEADYKDGDPRTLSLSLLLTVISLRHLSKSGSKASSKSSVTNWESAFKKADQLHQLASQILPSQLQYQLVDPTIQGALLEDLLQQPSLKKIDSLLDDNFIFGYTYQYWRTADRKRAQHEIQTANKEIDQRGLTAFTQIYTPDWVVDFLMANTLSPRIPNRISSSVMPPYTVLESFKSTASPLTEIRVLDPACGTGHFLLRAFDELIEAYQSAGYAKEPAARRILSHQLVGADIDSLALSILAFAYATKLINLGITQEMGLIEPATLIAPHADNRELMGSLERDWNDEHPLSQHYDVVLTNPPYIGRKLISREMTARLKKLFPGMHQDLNSAFIKRCLEFLKPGGSLGVITQNSIMFLPSHGNLRTTLLNDFRLKAAVEAGPGVFPLQGGEKVDSAILVVDRPTETEAQSRQSSVELAYSTLFLDL
ncbi:MAG: N-6 DNA methylase, partial [Cyanobacteria bacterium]|nr:N-6 DNA methylase [Cyanobacteriota bacterium]